MGECCFKNNKYGLKFLTNKFTSLPIKFTTVMCANQTIAVEFLWV
jgi:hypothetical protein